jgi:hypothetical protein
MFIYNISSEQIFVILYPSFEFVKMRLDFYTIFYIELPMSKISIGII